MRTKKAVINAVVSIIYQVTAVICGLITPRLILSHFGSTYNGVVSSANQFLEMISFLTLGVAGATRVALYKPIAENDVLKISQIVKSNKIFMRKVGAAIILYTGILCAVYPFVSHNDLSKIESAALVGIVGIGVFAQYFFGASNQTLLSADQSSYIYYGIQCGTIVANTVLSVILIECGCSIFTVKFGSAVVFLISPIILNVIVKKKYHLISNCSPDDSALKQRGAVAFHSIANIVHEDTDLIVLTLFTDAKLISVYTVYQLIAGKVRRMLLMLTNGLEGAFGNMWAKKEFVAFERNFRFFEFLIYSFTSIVFCCVGMLIVPFIRLYTIGVNDTNYILVGFAILTVVTETMYCIRHPYLIVVQATGNYESTKMGALYEALINIGLSLIFVNIWGLSGVMFGTLVANTFRTVQYAFFISNNIIKGSIKGSIRRFVWFLGNSATIITAQVFTLYLVPDQSGWIGWIMDGAIAFVVSMVITAFSAIVFYRSDLIKLVFHFKTTFIRNK